MMPAFVGKWFGRWAEPIGGFQGPLAVALRVLAIILRLYAANTFIQYGFDKLFGGNKVYAMDANFFRALGVPLPEVTQVMIGGLEFFGGLLLLVGLFTRLFAFFLACDMLTAMLTAGNTAVEGPLFVCCVLLIITGGGYLALDQLLDRWLAGRNAAPVSPPRPT